MFFDRKQMLSGQLTGRTELTNVTEAFQDPEECPSDRGLFC